MEAHPKVAVIGMKEENILDFGMWSVLIMWEATSGGSNVGVLTVRQDRNIIYALYYHSGMASVIPVFLIRPWKGCPVMRRSYADYPCPSVASVCPCHSFPSVTP